MTVYAVNTVNIFKYLNTNRRLYAYDLWYECKGSILVEEIIFGYIYLLEHGYASPNCCNSSIKPPGDLMYFKPLMGAY